MEATIYSIIPPLLAVIMVIATKRVLLSLGASIVVGALLIHDFSPLKAGSEILTVVKGIFVDGGELNTWYVYILIFLLMLGIITAFVSLTGGSRAFAEWAVKRIKTRIGAKFLAAIMGVIIFIDDYFNALAVGQISRPLTDRHKVSRAKLAYIIDSTSAPVCVISPVSSWGAFIIATIGTILVEQNVTNLTAFSAFIQMIPMNLYVFVALIMVFAVSAMNINLGSMKVHEERALKTGELVDPKHGQVPGELSSELPESKKGKVTDLILPIVALFIGTIGSMLATGYQAVMSTDENPVGFFAALGQLVTGFGDASILTIFENTDVAASLLYGGLTGLVVAFVTFFKQGLEAPLFGKAVVAGIKSMLPAIYILLFAWTLGSVIGTLETGTYLSEIVATSSLNIAYLPAILFILSGIMAFATGTSWGTFGIMLPIAGEIAVASDVTLLLPALSAVLAGAVFGDHCSPISDTTILSSTGAGSNHIDHVLTQLPYAIASGIFATIGYVVLGLTGSTVLGLAGAIGLLALFLIFIKNRKVAA